MIFNINTEHRLSYLRFVLSFLISTLSVFSMLGSTNQNARWAAMPNSELLKVGREYLHERYIPDSALAVFTILTERYYPAMTLDEKKDVVAALNGLWETYMFGYFDYTEASRTLQRSFDICEEAHLPLSRNYFNTGCMYQSMAELSGSSEALYKDALDNHRKAFYAAIKEGDSKVLVAVIDNIGSIAYAFCNPDILSKEIKILHNRAHELNLENDWRLLFGLKLYQGIKALSRSDYKEAKSLFCQMKEIVPSETDPEMARHVIFADLCIADAEEKAGNLSGAKTQRLKALALSQKFNIKDASLLCYDALSRQYENTDRETSLNYRTNYLMLKDSILNYRQFVGVKEMSVYQQLREFDREISDMKRKDERQNWFISIVLIIVTAVVMMLAIIYSKNRKLKATNHILYTRNLEYLKAEEERRKLDKERELTSSLPISSLPDNLINYDDNDHAYDNCDDAVSSPKYKNSQLTSEQKQEIMRKIMEVMEESEDIFQPGFNADSLSVLTGINYKYVSQVINEKKGCNFNVFLNEFRVKRACVLINSMSASMPITIEGIANKVGFRSRNAFAVAFKKFTGLTPSEYIKIAKTRNAE
ncbi:MAG: helix-turn-helix domain-containing protein [Bacteroides sp.]|nr:helix-turn-helix domain-containing protein [Bacteroides sp.]